MRRKATCQGRWASNVSTCGYVKTNKNDYIDAEAIAEAVQRPDHGFLCRSRPEEQLDLRAVHHVREGWVMRRTRSWRMPR